MAVGAIAGLTAGMYLLGKHLEEGEAKMRLIGATGGSELKSKFDLSADGAVKLSNSLETLAAKGITPTNELLEQIKQNAEAMGKDGGEAMAAWALAAAKGPEELKKWSEEFGKLAGMIDSRKDVAIRLGLDATALGIAKELTAEQQQQKEIEDAVDKAAVAHTEVMTLYNTRNAQLAEASNTSNSIDKHNHEVAAEELQKILRTQEDIEAQQKAKLETIQKTRDASKQAALEQGMFDREMRDKASEALSTSDKREANQIRMNIAKREEGRATVQLTAFDKAHGDVLDANLQKDRDAIVSKLDAGKAAEAAAIAERKALAKAAADAGKKHREEAAAHEIALAKAVAETKAGYANLAARSQGPEAMADANLANIRAAAIRELDAIRADTKKKGDVKLAESKAVEVKLIQQEADLAQEAVTRKIGLERGAQDAEGNLATTRLQAERDQAERSGDIDKTRALDKELNSRSLNAELLGLERELNDAKQQLYGADLEAFKRTNDAKVNDARAKNSSKNAGDEDKNYHDDLSKAADKASGAISAVERAGGKSGAALSSAAKSAQQLTKDWKGITAAGPDMISAAGGVAASFVDGEKEKAAIMAITEAAAAAASFATGNIPGGVGHATSAALYASVAGGLIGGGSSAAGAPSGASGGTSSNGSGNPFSPSGGGANSPPVVNVYYGVLGTQQQQGLMLQQAIAATKGTGYSGKGI